MLDTSRAIRDNLFAAMIIVGAIGGAVFAWSVFAPLEGAVVATGTVIVEGNVKKIQHPTGGIVGEIKVEEGQRVEQGDMLLRLDETVTRSNLAIVVNDLTAQRARLSRLQAFRDGLKEPVFAEDLVKEAFSNETIRSVLEGEAKLGRFQLRTREEQRAQLAEQIKQLRQEIKGLEEQQKALVGQLDIARRELSDLMPLYKSGNVQRMRVTGLEREVLRSQGMLGDNRAKIAQSQAKIAETELQIVQNEHDFITDVIKQLRETETKITELQERKITAEDQLQRLEIRSPIAGRVHQLSVHTIGGVITPSETSHADRAQHRPADRRSAGEPVGHRPARGRPGDARPVLGFQQADDGRT